MHIEKVSIKNFRLLADVELFLEAGATLIVGRNNSGKTSLSELFRRLLSERSPSFRLEDFSLSSHHGFWDAFQLYLHNGDVTTIRQHLPLIKVSFTIAYDKGVATLGPLADFIVDLDSNCTTTLITMEYRLKDGQMHAFFSDLGVDFTTSIDKQKTDFFRSIRDRLLEHYALSVWAVDPGDPNNSKVMQFYELRALMQGGFINAQRGLDDTTHKEANPLGKVLEGLLTAAMADSADKQERDTANKLETAVKAMQAGLDAGFNQKLQELLPTFALFGYPGLADPRLVTETSLDVERLLTDHTKVHYAGINGINLPETYNGLGVRNLVLILLRLYEFFKLFKTQSPAPGLNLVFIEEPEVHLHPQTGNSASLPVAPADESPQEYYQTI